MLADRDGIEVQKLADLDVFDAGFGQQEIADALPVFVADALARKDLPPWMKSAPPSPNRPPIIEFWRC